MDDENVWCANDRAHEAHELALGGREDERHLAHLLRTALGREEVFGEPELLAKRPDDALLHRLARAIGQVLEEALHAHEYRL